MRHVAHYLDLVKRDPGDWRTIQGDLGQIRRAWSAIPPEDRRLIVLATAMRMFHKRWGLTAEGIAWCRQAFQAARSTGDHGAQADLLTGLGALHEDRSEWQAALACYN